jgi:hypothetical protein
MISCIKCSKRFSNSKVINVKPVSITGEDRTLSFGKSLVCTKKRACRKRAIKLWDSLQYSQALFNCKMLWGNIERRLEEQFMEDLKWQRENYEKFGTWYPSDRLIIKMMGST